jgi:hypothetical protein
MWTDIVQAVAAVVTAAITVIGFCLVLKQMRQVDRSIRGSTYGSLYAQQNAITQYLVDNPTLRPYIYGNKDIVPSDPNHEQVRALAEMFTDFFEHVSSQRENLPCELWPRWFNFIRTVWETSPALRKHLRENRAWYTHEFLSLFEGLRIPESDGIKA